MSTKPAPPPRHAPPVSDQMMVAIPIESSSAGIDAVPLQIATNPSTSSAAGVALPSSYRTEYILATYLLPLLVTIVTAAIARYYLVFLAPAVVVITVLIGLCVWMAKLNMRDFGVDGNGQPTMTKRQLIHLMIARFTLGFWVLGGIMLLILGLEATVIAYIPIHNQVAAWFFIVFMSYILFSLQFWVLVYLITIDRSGAGVTGGEVKLKCISTMAVAMGCTTAQLWSGFYTFAYNLGLFSAITGIDINAQVNVLIMVVATLITMTLLPMDACGAEYLVLRARMCSVVNTGGVDENQASLARGGNSLVFPVLLRGSLLISMFVCLIGILVASNSYAAAVIVYLIVACLMIIPFNIHTTRYRAWLDTLTQQAQQHEQKGVDLLVQVHDTDKQFHASG